MAKPTIKQIKGMRKACKALARYLFMSNTGIAGMGNCHVIYGEDDTLDDVGFATYCHKNTIWVITTTYGTQELGYLLQKYKIDDYGAVNYTGRCYFIPQNDDCCPVYKRIARVTPKHLHIKYTLTYINN